MIAGSRDNNQALGNANGRVECVVSSRAIPSPSKQGKVPKNTVQEGAQISRYVIFFEPDKTAMNAAAQSTINRIAETFRTARYTAISITGHSDTVGTSAYRMKKAERAANSAMASLIAAGVPADAITTAWKGEEGEKAAYTFVGILAQ